MIDETVPYRIKKIYASSTEKEKAYLRKILEEIAETGDSQTYRDIWLEDYIEIPVDIDTFICDDQYLGKITRNGNAVYPFWRDFMRKLFHAGNKYEEVMFTGATRIGKSSTAITCTAYMLYKLMCLRDPQAYFGKKDVSVFSILFFNLTKELASSVAYREFQDTLLASNWFLEHGKRMGSDKNPYYVPNGEKIVINYGSDAAHGLGMQVFCLSGSTKVLTESGYRQLEDLQDQIVSVGQYHDDCIIYSDAQVKLTKYVEETIRVELEDGTIIEGTPDHKVQLTDGTYKELGKLSSSDDLLTLNIDEVDQMNLKDRSRKFVVYKHTTPSNKVYVGITCEPPEKRWGRGGSGYFENLHFKNAILKYGWDNIQHEILYTDLSIEDAAAKEIELVAEYDSANPEHGYNGTLGVEVGFPSEETRAKLRAARYRLSQDPAYAAKLSNSLKGHLVSEETRRKISEANRGRKLSKPSPLKGRKLSEEHKQALRGRPSWILGHTKDTHPSVKKISEKQLGVPKSESVKQKLRNSALKRYQETFIEPTWVNDGEIEKIIDLSKVDVPEGFQIGRLDLNFVYLHDPETDKEIRVPSSQVSCYLDCGWIIGPSNKRRDSISRSRRKYCWFYDGHEFPTASLLAEYLNANGYPKIVSSTITALYNTGFDKSKEYSSLHGKIIRKEMIH